MKNILKGMERTRDLLERLLNEERGVRLRLEERVTELQSRVFVLDHPK